MTNRAALIDRYRSGSADVEDALVDIAPEELDRRPAANEWSPREIAHHLADSESMAYTRLRRLIAEDEPIIQGYDEPTFARRLHYDRPIASSIAVLRAVRAASLELLESLSPEDWDRTGTHTESGPYSSTTGSRSTPPTRTTMPIKSGGPGEVTGSRSRSHSRLEVMSQTLMIASVIQAGRPSRGVGLGGSNPLAQQSGQGHPAPRVGSGSS